ncbi:MAG: glycosyltransferase [Oligoflexia bacterium]|nr:glycosyltransferase [Oligoflexia bacterium]
MKAVPFFSIIVPVSREIATLHNFVDSLLQQSYGNFELILGIEKNFDFNHQDARIKIVKSDSKHPNRKRNLAAKIAIGQWYVFTDDDTLPPANWLSNAYAILSENTNINVLSGSGHWPSNNWKERIINHVLYNRFFQAKPHGENTNQSIKQIPFHQCSFYNIFVRADLFNSILGTNEYANMYIDDTEFFYLLRKDSKFYASSSIITNHRIRSPFFSFFYYLFERRFMTGLNFWVFPEIFIKHTPVLLAIATGTFLLIIYFLFGYYILALLILEVFILYISLIFQIKKIHICDYIFYPWIFLLSQIFSLTGFILGLTTGWLYPLLDVEHKRGRMLFKIRDNLKRTPLKRTLEDNVFISIIIPAYNETESIAELERNLSLTISFFEKENKNIECLIIDDGSNQEIKIENPKIKVLRINKNLGKSYALLLGIFASSSKKISTMDADLQHDSLDIYKIYKENLITDQHIVGIRKKIHSESTYKRYLSILGNKCINIFLGFKSSDFGSGFQIFSAEMPSFQYGSSSHRNFLMKSFLHKQKIIGWPISLKERKYGQSKFGSFRILTFLIDFFYNFIETKIPYKISSKFYILYGSVLIFGFFHYFFNNIFMAIICILLFFFSCYYNEKRKRGMKF